MKKISILFAALATIAIASPVSFAAEGSGGATVNDARDGTGSVTAGGGSSQGGGGVSGTFGENGADVEAGGGQR